MITIPKRLKGEFNCQPYDIDASLPAMQVLKKLPVKFPAEVVDGQLYVHEPMMMDHVKACMEIKYQIWDMMHSKKIGEMFGWPLGVFFSKRNTCVMPDIFFISKQREHLLKEKGLVGAPDLIIEILSPGTRTYDFTTKKDLYEKHGVAEYWIVDPESKDTFGFLLKNGKYGDPLMLKDKINLRTLKKSIKF